MSDKNFKVKHGLQVSSSVIITSGDNVGIGQSPIANKTLTISGSISSSGILHLQSGYPYDQFTGEQGKGIVFGDELANDNQVNITSYNGSLTFSSGSHNNGVFAHFKSTDKKFILGGTSNDVSADTLTVIGSISASQQVTTQQLNFGDLGGDFPGRGVLDRQSSGKVILYTSNTGQAFTAHQQPDNKVYLGLGTAAPTHRLSVVGDISASGDLLLQGDYRQDFKFPSGSNWTVGIREIPQGTEETHGHDITIQAGNAEFDGETEFYGIGGNVILEPGAKTASGRKGQVIVNSNLSASGTISASGIKVDNFDLENTSIAFASATASGDLSASGALIGSTINIGGGDGASAISLEGDISMSGTGQLTHSGQFYNEAGNMKIGQSDTSKKQMDFRHTGVNGGGWFVGVDTDGDFKINDHSDFEPSSLVEISGYGDSYPGLRVHNGGLFTETGIIQAASFTAVSSSIVRSINKNSSGNNDAVNQIWSYTYGDAYTQYAVNVNKQGSGDIKVWNIGIDGSDDNKFKILFKETGSGQTTFMNNKDDQINMSEGSEVEILNIDPVSKVTSYTSPVTASEGLFISGSEGVNHLEVHGDATFGNNIAVSGFVTAQQFNASYESSSIFYGSGSTKLGDSQDDKHSFTGSLQILGTTSSADFGQPNYIYSSSLGINTKVPLSALHIASESANILTLERTTAGATNMKWHFGIDSSDRLQISSKEAGTPYPTIQMEKNTSGTPYLHINSTGEVGIGTGDNPPKTLTVAGEISASRSTHFGKYHSDVHSYTGSLDVKGSITGSKLRMTEIHLTDGDGVGGLRFTNTNTFITASSTTSDSSLQLSTGGNLQIFLDSDNDDTNEFVIHSHEAVGGTSNKLFNVLDTGYVGIGNSTPDKALTVEGDISASGHIYTNKAIWFGNNANDYIDATISSSNESLQIADNSNVDIIIDKNGTDTDGKFAVKTWQGQTTRFMVSSSGNVGIGTLNPSMKLTVAGDISSSGNYYVQADGVTYSPATIKKGLQFISGSGEWLGAINSHFGHLDVSSSKHVYLMTGDNFNVIHKNTAGQVAQQLYDSGEMRVGIPTDGTYTVPSTTLEVFGDISSSGNIHAFNDLSASQDLIVGGTATITGALSASMGISSSILELSSSVLRINNGEDQGASQFLTTGNVYTNFGGPVTTQQQLTVNNIIQNADKSASFADISSSANVRADGYLSGSGIYSTGPITASSGRIELGSPLNNYRVVLNNDGSSGFEIMNKDNQEKHNFGFWNSIIGANPSSGQHVLRVFDYLSVNDGVKYDGGSGTNPPEILTVNGNISSSNVFSRPNETQYVDLVSGSVTASGDIILDTNNKNIYGTSTTGNKLMIAKVDSANQLVVGNNGQSELRTMIFNTYQNSGVLYLTSSGANSAKVGINTITPTHDLSVHGGISASGDFFAGWTGGDYISGSNGSFKLTENFYTPNQGIDSSGSFTHDIKLKEAQDTKILIPSYSTAGAQGGTHERGHHITIQASNAWDTEGGNVHNGGDINLLTGLGMGSGHRTGKVFISSSDAYKGESARDILEVFGHSDFNGNVTIDGNLTAKEYIVSSSVTHMTTSFSSGSTTFGNSVDDNHTFNGEITASGRISSSGIIYGNDVQVSNQYRINSVPIATYLGGIQFGDGSHSVEIDGRSIKLDASVTASGIISASQITIDRDKHLNFNNAQAGDDYIAYISNEDHLQIKSNDIALMPEYSVGIGKTSPTRKLEVVGDISGSGHFNVEGSGSFGSVVTSSIISADSASVATKLFHYGDENTYLEFPNTNDGVRLAGGGTTYVSIGHNNVEPHGKLVLGDSNGKTTISGSNVDLMGPVSASGTVSASLLRSSGDVVAYYTSDERLKYNIQPIENPVEKVSQLRGVRYNWNGSQDIYPEGSNDSGIIAQDVKKVLPELVHTNPNGYLGVKHDRLVGLLIEAVKEQQGQIDELKDEVKKLKGDK